MSIEAVSVERQFSLRRPCSECPFLKDKSAILLREGRREEIMEALLSGQALSFPCHKSVYRSSGVNFDAEGVYTPVDITQCAGAAAVARKFGRDTIIVQVATRLGHIDDDHYADAATLTMEPADLSINKFRSHM